MKSRMERLEKGCAAVADYNEEVGELIIWLKEFEPKLNISVQLDSTDPKEIKNLQGLQSQSATAILDGNTKNLNKVCYRKSWCVSGSYISRPGFMVNVHGQWLRCLLIKSA